jgi:hypothetical protein
LPRTFPLRRFGEIEWNLRKIEDQTLTPEDVEAAFDRVFQFKERRDGSYEMDAETPSG